MTHLRTEKRQIYSGEMKDDPASRAAALWEQWLQRLSGAENHEADFFRVELLELVADSLIDSDQFFARFGTILQRCVAVPVLLIMRNDRSAPLFSNISRNKEELLLKLLPSSTPSAMTITEKKLRNPIATDFVSEPLRVIYYFPLQQESVTAVIVAPAPLSPEQRHFLHFVESLLGIRRRRQLLQNQLTQEQQRLTALTHHLSEGLAVVTKELDITIWNRPLHQLTGYSLKDTLGRKAQDFLRPISGDNWLTKLIEEYQSQVDKTTFMTEFQIETKSKKQKWVSVSGSFIRDADNQISQTIILLRDVSHLKELEQRKNEFISIATHELRTPLTAVKGYLSLLGADTSLFSEKQLSYLSRANEATERLVRLAEDLLQVIRVEENRLQFNYQPVELKKLLGKIVKDFQQKAAQKNLILTFEAPEDATISADRVRTEQIFANLIDNALKYTRRGSVTVLLRIVADSAKAVVEIRDTGVGIEPKDLSGIFEKFHRAKTAATSGESGVGLGLYIVKSFIEKQRGTITVQSRAGRGTTFSVSFPLRIKTKTRRIK